MADGGCRSPGGRLADANSSSLALSVISSKSQRVKQSGSFIEHCLVDRLLFNIASLYSKITTPARLLVDVRRSRPEVDLVGARLGQTATSSVADCVTSCRACVTPESLSRPAHGN